MLSAKVPVPFQAIADTLVSAFEGGSNYWYEIKRFQKPKNFANSDPEDVRFRHISYPVNVGGAVIVGILEGEDSTRKGKTFRLDLEAIQKGLDWLAVNRPQDLGTLLSEDGDADTADTFLQACLFQEIVFG